ncbi:AAA family ATPase [Flavobacterium sp.]
MKKKELKLDVKKEMEKHTSLFKTMSSNDWIEYAKNNPIPKMLFGELWFENEMAILFADTNLGKSIVAVQIANSLSKGTSTANVKNETDAQIVLYLDFELTSKQFENRYSTDFKDHYVFNANFMRSELDLEKIRDTDGDFEDELLKSLESEIVSTCAKVLIVDNITYLKNETEKAKDALRLMKTLNALKKKLNISILVLAHTPKRDSSKPLSNNDLSGSKNLMNFCDSSFAIGESFTETGIRYIKQIKERNCPKIYHAENILVYRIEKKNSFLRFEFIEYGDESDHLIARTKADTIERNNLIIELNKEGVNNCEIARKLGISEGTVRYVLEQNK